MMQSLKLGPRCIGASMPLLPPPPPCTARLPQAPRKPGVLATARHSFAASCSHRNESACSSSSSAVHQAAPLVAGFMVPAALHMAVASPARADDPILAAGSAADAAAGTTADAVAGPASDSLITLTAAAPNDPVITVLFYFAVSVLSVVTLGVAYLAITGWLDDRKEKEDRKTYETSLAQRQMAQDREKVAANRKPPRRRTAGSGKGGGKGFS